MNYITKLQNEREQLQERLVAVDRNIDWLIAHLHSAKFAGEEQGGGRKDWIATADVLHWLLETRQLILVR